MAEFDLFRLSDVLKKCKNEDESINMDRYIDAYEEVCKLLCLLGPLFKFVVSDVVDKIGILKDYRNSSTAAHYETIQKMITHEVKNNLTGNRQKPSGSRTLLRLHRALEFIIEFLKKLSLAGDGEKLSVLTSEAYDKTLARFHPWLIRKGVGIATYALPSKSHFLNSMKHSNALRVNSELQLAATLAKPVYDTVQNLYASENLLNLD